MAKYLLPGILAALFLTACGGPVPSGMYLTLSVSVRDVAVETSINGKPNAFVSGDTGSITGSMPLNKYVKTGENEVTFTLTPIDVIEAPEPAFLGSLQISLPGDVVDTLESGDRVIFKRELSVEEHNALSDGQTVSITERFDVDKAELEAMKFKAS